MSAQRPEQSVGALLKRAEQSMVRAKSAALKPLGITLAQYVALSELEREPSVTAAALARACFVTPQSMMIVLKSSEEQGLIARTPHPRHANVLELDITAPGREALEAARRLLEPIEARLAGAFSARELDTLRRLLDRWIDAFEGSDSPSPVTAGRRTRERSSTERR
jgi:DNA-binding MarR family transcriptional regulator